MKRCISLLAAGVLALVAGRSDAQVTKSQTKTKAVEAYELRMAGKADQAEQLLTDWLKVDSTDALANFELARTAHHIFLGSRDMSPEAWTKVVNASSKAALLAPNNVSFSFYAAYARLFDAFISMMTGAQDAGQKTKVACDAFGKVLELDPKCSPARLYLVDVYAMLPPEMGGDRNKAGQVADELMAYDPVCGTVAKTRLLPDTTDFVTYWQAYQKEHGSTARISEEIGRAFLIKSDGAKGEAYYREAIKADPGEKWLTWNLVRFHLMSTQQDPAQKDAHLQTASALVQEMLDGSPALCNPMKAYGYGTLALLKQVGGDNAAAETLRNKAKETDGFYSGATGAPSEMLFFQPDKVKVIYSSFFLPF
jgi:hypothetical protein